MEKIKTTLERRFDGVYYAKDGGVIPINNWQEFRLDTIFEKTKKVEVEIEGELVFNEKKNKNQFKPKSIIFQGKEYTRTHNDPIRIVEPEPEKKIYRDSRPPQHFQNQRFNRGNQSEERLPATSPYNFVPINTQVIESNAKEIDFSHFSGNNGYIDFEIETLGLMFIRGKGSDFFKINNEFTIPGSSFRGLTRSLVEVMSFSKMNLYEKNKKLFMRFIAASKSDFKKNYYEKMGLSEDKIADVQHLANAGFLKFDKKNKIFYVYPTSFQTFVQPSAPSFRISRNGNQYEVFSGKIDGKKKHYRMLLPNPLQNPIIVERKVIKEYESDTTRKIGIDIIKGAKDERNYPNGIPIFYAQIENVITSIGHTKNYRIPYDNAIGDANSDPHRSEIVDFAESIFGIIDDRNSLRTRAGKVFFEDCMAINKPTEHPEKTPKVLGSPRPTSFQLYLEQPKGIVTPVEELHHWDSENAVVRGNKFYWHRFLGNQATEPLDIGNWAVDRNHEKFNEKTSPKPIKALEKGVKFKGRIRFENLSDEELGALLMALCLPEGCKHKIGMAKSLGLGSVSLNNVKVSLKSIEKRYSQLFDYSNDFETGIIESVDNQVFIDKFITFMITELKKKDLAIGQNYWEIPRMKELKTMLLFNENAQSKNDWIDKTKYQTLKDFTKRRVLPKPSEISHTLK